MNLTAYFYSGATFEESKEKLKWDFKAGCLRDAMKLIQLKQTAIGLPLKTLEVGKNEEVEDE